MSNQQANSNKIIYFIWYLRDYKVDTVSNFRFAEDIVHNKKNKLNHLFYYVITTVLNMRAPGMSLHKLPFNNQK